MQYFPPPDFDRTSKEKKKAEGGIKNVIRENLETLRNTPEAFRLVWAASRANTMISFGLTPIAALLPAAQSWVGKMIVDSILNAVNQSADIQTGLRMVLPYVAGEFGLLLLSTILSSIRFLSNSVLQSLLTNHINTMIIKKAISLDLQFFEDPVFYDNMQNARRRADSSALAIMNAILQIVQQTITLVSCPLKSNHATITRCPHFFSFFVSFLSFLLLSFFPLLFFLLFSFSFFFSF